MQAEWSIDYWPLPGFHVFLSHCAEDRPSLVEPVYQRLKKQRLIPWFDQSDYPPASDPFVALRENLLRCRHVAYFITNDFLHQGRGWSAVERAYADLIQSHLKHRSNEISCVELPLIFDQRTDIFLRQIGRSAWAPLLAKASWYEDRPNKNTSPIQWAVNTVKLLIQQDSGRGLALEDRLKFDPELSQFLNERHGLLDRVKSWRTV